MIKAILFDIDGVFTDGSILIDQDGRESKRINLKDIDAVYDLKRRGFLIGAITGEDTGICRYFEKRFPWDFFYSGTKDKLGVVKSIEKQAKLTPAEICYIGDGWYDIAALSYVGFSVCPHDAIQEIIETAKVRLKKRGGDGCVWELRRLLLADTEAGIIVKGQEK